MRRDSRAGLGAAGTPGGAREAERRRPRPRVCGGGLRRDPGPRAAARAVGPGEGAASRTWPSCSPRSCRSGAIVLVGGDWMPYARLMVPVVPSLVYAAVLASRHASALGTAATAARSLIAMGLGVVLLARGGSAGATGGRRPRGARCGRARPLLEATQRVAALDIELGERGHRSRRDRPRRPDGPRDRGPSRRSPRRSASTRGFFLARAPDACCSCTRPRGLATGGLDAWQDTLASRGVEAHLSSDEVIGRHFAPSAWLPLGSNGSGYILLRSR